MSTLLLILAILLVLLVFALLREVLDLGQEMKQQQVFITQLIGHLRYYLPVDPPENFRDHIRSELMQQAREHGHKGAP
jgi:hypothetical protein